MGLKEPNCKPAHPLENRRLGPNLPVIEVVAALQTAQTLGGPNRSGAGTKFVVGSTMSESRHVVCPHCAGVNRVPADRLAEGAKCGRCKHPLFLGKPLAITGADFQTQLGRSDIPLLVDFWAPWCGPCKMMAPAFEQAAAELEPVMRLLKVNTEEQQALAAQFGIRSIPTMILFSGGREVNRLSGALDAGGIVAWARQQRV